MRPIEILPWSDYCRLQAFPLETLTEGFAGESVAVVNAELLGNKSHAALLFSRLPRLVNSEDRWLKSTREAVKDVASRGEAIVAGSGVIGWDYTAWFAARLELPMVVVLPPGRMKSILAAISEFEQDLGISQQSTAFIMALTDAKLSKQERLQIRDRMVFSLAHRCLPICLRQGSGWTKWLEVAESVDRNYLADYPPKPTTEWMWLRERDQMPTKGIRRNRLCHWTRGQYAPWEGETQAQYFAELTAAKTGNPRDGFHTLMKIASESLIRGVARMNRQGESVVSFTSLDPFEAIKLMSYRTTLGHWTYEPYGLEFPADDLKNAGVSQVIYGDDEVFERLSDDQKAFFQFCGNPETGISWTAETEWRLCGGFDFSHLLDRVILWTPRKAEAIELHRLTGLSTTSFEEQLGRSART